MSREHTAEASAAPVPARASTSMARELRNQTRRMINSNTYKTPSVTQGIPQIP
ncbi:hypothetical protein HOE425_330532 [Hoeflea sp. EC-HK425]|nr:hypothetical protein HOE425_330532 [Hoeflea sp. EC-HK425]